MFLSCEFVYVISDIQKSEYENIFGKKCKVLTKCADFSSAPDIKKEIGSPIKLVYTGNLGNGRWKSLSYIKEALKSINSDGKKAELHIYSGTPLTKRQLSKMSDGFNAIFKGCCNSDEIENIQKDADILVHVEGMSLKHRLQTHQSFSTKIVDYLKNARAIFVVGSKSTASVDYFLKNDSAIVATDRKSVLPNLCRYIDDAETIKQYSEKAYLCGRENHSLSEVKSMVYKDLLDTVKKR